MIHDFSDITGEGILHINGIIGLITRTQLLSNEIPDPSYIYVLYHPRHRRDMWVLENINELEELPQSREELVINEPPDVTFVYFCVDPEFDYLSFEENEYEAHIEWNENYSMQHVIDYIEEE